MTAYTNAEQALLKITDPVKRDNLLNALKPEASWVDKVRAFHILYDVPDASGQELDLTASHMTDDRIEMRVGLVTEEVEELAEAAANRDVIEMADALGDIIYVVVGFALELGIDLNPVITEIQASNMTKLAEDGSVIRRADQKILKGPNFVQPDIKSALLS